MLYFKNLILILLFLFVATITFAQIDNFVSPDGGFKISLPKDSVGSSGVTPSQAIKGGSVFSWKVPQGRFLVGFVDLNASPDEAKQILQKQGDDLVKNMTNYGGKLVERKDVLLEKNPGTEIRVQFPDNGIAITRFYLVNTRIYNLTTQWSADGNGAAQLKILNSFQLIPPKKS